MIERVRRGEVMMSTHQPTVDIQPAGQLRMSHYVALRFEAAGRYKPTVPIKVSTASSSEVKDNECYQRTGNDDSKGACGVDWE